MKLYAQQGHGTGDKIKEGLSRRWIDGAIFSPKDCNLEQLKAHIESCAQAYQNADLLVDPQFYATLIALADGARLGQLSSEDYMYFEARRRSQLESEVQIKKDLESVLNFQEALPVTHVIAPNILIPRSLNSAEAVIAKNFIRNTRSIWESFNDPRQVYATLAIGAEALRDKYELNEFLTDLTLIDPAPHGFYLLIRNDLTLKDPIDSQVFAAWLLLNHSLKINGYQIINGYSDILTPFLGVAGGDSGATGWYSNLKSFTLERFSPSASGMQQPIARYLSCQLLNSIRFDELERLRDVAPQILNNLDSDTFYTPANGSKPKSRQQEILQSWQAITHMINLTNGKDLISGLLQCKEWIKQARQLYARINTYPGLQLLSRSNDAHLDKLHYGINIFLDLAEINLSND